MRRRPSRASCAGGNAKITKPIATFRFTLGQIPDPEGAMQYRRISADCHLDLPWLPPELFVSQAARELKDRMPYVEDGPEGPRWMTRAGVVMGIPGAVGSVGAPFVPGQNYRVDKMAETGLYEAGKRGERRPGDPHLRIKEMEKDGVDAEIIFGILGVASRVQDH